MKTLRCANCGGEVQSDDLATAICHYCGQKDVLIPVDQILDQGIPRIVPAKLDAQACRNALDDKTRFRKEPRLLLVPFWMLRGCYRFAYYSVEDIEHGFGARKQKQRWAEEWSDRSACCCASTALFLEEDPLSNSGWSRSDWELARPCKTWEGVRMRTDRSADEAQSAVSVYFENEATETVNREVFEIEMFRGRFEMQSYELVYRPIFCFHSGKGEQVLVDAVCGKRVGRGQPTEASGDSSQSSCPSCGAPVEARQSSLASKCESCGTEVLVHNRTVEAVPEHRALPVKITLDEVRRVYPQGDDWKLAILPFWSLQGDFQTQYLAFQFEEGLLRATRIRDRSSQADRQVWVTVPARPLATFGITWEAATSLPAVEFPQLCLDENSIEYEEFAVPSDAEIKHGTVPLKEARSTAREVMQWVQRDHLHQAHEDLELMNSNAQIGRSYLIHVPVFVGRDKNQGGQLVVNAFSGEGLNYTPKVVSLKSRPRKSYFYPRLFAAAALSVVGNVSLHQMWMAHMALLPKVGTLWAILLAIVPQILAFQLFVFVLKDPRGVLETEGFDSISIFDPLLAYRQNRTGQRGIVLQALFAAAYVVSPFLILLSPLMLCFFPLAKAVWGRFTGKPFWRTLWHEFWQTVHFFVRTGALFFTGGVVLWGLVYSLWIAFGG